MDMSWCKYAKPEPRVLVKKRQQLDQAAQERICRAHVKARDKGRCVVPGCKTPKDGLEMHHVIPRSRSKALKWKTGNNCLLCRLHHRMRHAGVIDIRGDADGELIITGARKHLEFRL